ncbi:hypothetical protein H5410_022685 [Solanum commersonii]|uniref:Uncharacterized protein n=1 Tax=Solanum commersonii TaxID=4109 RepID=A0A9J5ZIH1_SOLCO|nr:hypothetical protein H5410_022685 [Solanum commersonii]
MTSKSQRNEDGGQERSRRNLGEKGEVFDTNQLDEKIIRVEAGLSALNRRLVIFENNFSSLETIALEGLDEVKSNLVELEEVNKEGLTNLELKLTEALSSLHKGFETLKRQVDETVGAGVASPVTAPARAGCHANGGPSEKQGGQAGGTDKGKNIIVGMFNHMVLFNHMTLAALAAQPASARSRESLFVNAKLNGKDVRIMLDTGATHNFVKKERAKDLCFNYVASDTMLKTVKHPPFHIDLGRWKGLKDFTIAPMDVFDIILRMDFLYEVNAFILPRLNQLHISDALAWYPLLGYHKMGCTCPPCILLRALR